MSEDPDESQELGGITTIQPGLDDFYNNNSNSNNNNNHLFFDDHEPSSPEPTTTTTTAATTNKKITTASLLKRKLLSLTSHKKKQIPNLAEGIDLIPDGPSVVIVVVNFIYIFIIFVITNFYHKLYKQQ